MQISAVSQALALPQASPAESRLALARGTRHLAPCALGQPRPFTGAILGCWEKEPRDSLWCVWQLVIYNSSFRAVTWARAQSVHTAGCFSPISQTGVQRGKASHPKSPSK